MSKTLALLVIFHLSVSLCAQQKAERKALAITHVAVVDTAGARTMASKPVD